MAIRPAPLLAVVLAALAMLHSPAAASAQEVQRAEALWFEADFDAARAEFTALLARADLTVADALVAHRYLAALASMRGDDAGARAHAEAAVALDASAAPPEGAARGAITLFANARSRFAGRTATLTLESRASTVADGRIVVIARLEPAPSGLVSVVALRCGSEDATSASDSASLEVAARGSVVCTAEARSVGGAVLFRLRRAFESGHDERVVGGLNEDDARDGDTSRRRRIGMLAGGTAGAVIAAVVTGVVVHGRNADAHFGGTTVVGW